MTRAPRAFGAQTANAVPVTLPNPVPSEPYSRTCAPSTRHSSSCLPSPIRCRSVAPSVGRNRYGVSITISGVVLPGSAPG